MSDNIPNYDTLAAIPHRWAQPPDSMVSKIPKGNTTLDYVGHADVTLMLIDADPAWSWRPLAWDGETGGPKIVKEGNRLVMWGELTVCGVTRLCVGTCQANMDAAQDYWQTDRLAGLFALLDQAPLSGNSLQRRRLVLSEVGSPT